MVKGKWFMHFIGSWLIRNIPLEVKDHSNLFHEIFRYKPFDTSTPENKKKLPNPSFSKGG